MVYILFFVISFLASIAGAICGIGGGVIIKPLLDSFWANGCKDDKLPVWLYGLGYEYIFFCSIKNEKGIFGRYADRDTSCHRGCRRGRFGEKFVSGACTVF